MTEYVKCVSTRRVTADACVAMDSITDLCIYEYQHIGRALEDEKADKDLLSDLQKSFKIIGMCLLKIRKESDALERDGEAER